MRLKVEVQILGVHKLCINDEAGIIIVVHVRLAAMVLVSTRMPTQLTLTPAYPRPNVPQSANTVINT